jgi:hypothetical protein
MFVVLFRKRVVPVCRKTNSIITEKLDADSDEHFLVLQHEVLKEAIQDSL